MTYPPQQPQGDWGGQQPYDPSQQGYGQQQPMGFDQQLPNYNVQPAADPYGQQPDPYGQQPDPYSAPPADPYAPQQPAYDPTQYSAPPVSVAPASGQPYPGQSYPGAPMMQAPAPSSGPPVWIFIVGGVVVLALIGVVVFFAINAGGDDPDDKPTDSAQSSSQQPSDDPTSGAPDGDMIVDTNTGLGYKAMAGWDTMDTSSSVPVPGFTSFQGQSYEVASEWIALLGIGEVDAAAVGYKDSGDLKDAVKALAKEYDKSNFGEDPKGLERDQKAEYDDSDLAGKKAITMAYHLTWDEGENPDTGEQIVFALIDVGDGKVAGFVGSLPDSTPSTQVDEAVAAAGTLAFS